MTSNTLRMYFVLFSIFYIIPCIYAAAVPGLRAQDLAALTDLCNAIEPKPTAKGSGQNWAKDCKINGTTVCGDFGQGRWAIGLKQYQGVKCKPFPGTTNGIDSVIDRLYDIYIGTNDNSFFFKRNECVRY